MILSKYADSEEVKDMKIDTIKMNEFVSVQDLKAFEVYLRLLKNPYSYSMEDDFVYLKHWVDLTSENFASRLKKEYPRLTDKEMNVCCFLRMGYSIEAMSRMLHVKEGSIKRTPRGREVTELAYQHLGRTPLATNGQQSLFDF